MKKILTAILIFFSAVLTAQVVNPIHWSVKLIDNDHYELRALIDNDWHLYDIRQAEGGPMATSFYVSDRQVAVQTLSTPITQYDDMFEMELSFYEKEALFSLPLSEVGGAEELTVRYMACSSQMCLSPTDYVFTLPQAQSEANPTSRGEQRGLLWIFLMGMLGGLLAIFTPCVWPIIPMTISFFMKRSGNSRAVKEAVLYGLAIVVIYVGLGLLITLLFGASALNSLSTNAVVNLIFFALLVIFALSFFGAFELTLPSSWSTRLNSRAKNTTGFLSIMFMAFTLVIVSFSCTGPIIGTLLVEAAGKSLLAPTVGMLGFAIALALPFSLFALFPDMMKRVPRSGGWMDSFKVTLAFLELALSLKFFSVADLAYGWHLLDRETFLALWIVIFALLGLYLLRLFRFKHEEPTNEGISVFRFMLAVVSLSFAIYMVPGLWGAPLKAVSAFAPPLYTQDFQLSANHDEQTHVTSSQLQSIEQAALLAKQQGKQLLLDFSGYGCVNCRKMEAKVLSDTRVKQRLQDFVLLTLMVDDKTKLDEPVTVSENGKQIVLKTIGDKWSYVQRTEFGANAQPYYVRIDQEGKTIGEPYAYDEDVDKFLQWLE